MNIRDELLDEIDMVLSRAVSQRAKIRKRVDAGVADESHLAYADGVVSGLEDAKVIVANVFREGDCRDIV